MCSSVLLSDSKQTSDVQSQTGLSLSTHTHTIAFVRSFSYFAAAAVADDGSIQLARNKAGNIGMQSGIR